MRVFDAVIVASAADLDLLEARFTEYQDLPVVHVIVEAAADFQGGPKPLHFVTGEKAGAAYGDRFASWYGRWNHVRVEPWELPAKDPKARKDALREKLADGTAAEPGDIVMHGAIDELPAAWAVEEILAGKTLLPIGTEMRWCCYQPGLVHPLPWRGTVAQQWRRAGSFAGLREQRATLPALVNAGTRLSMLGEPAPQDLRHPDGHQLRETEVDATWPRLLHAKTL